MSRPRARATAAAPACSGSQSALPQVRGITATVNRARLHPAQTERIRSAAVTARSATGLWKCRDLINIGMGYSIVTRWRYGTSALFWLIAPGTTVADSSVYPDSETAAGSRFAYPNLFVHPGRSSYEELSQNIPEV